MMAVNYIEILSFFNCDLFQHIKNKKEELNIIYRKLLLVLLLGRGYELPIQNKLMIRKQILKPVRVNGIQL